MDWRHKAVCRDEDPELFFPVGNSGPALAQVAAAKKVCNRCPVTSMSEDERRALKRRKNRGRGRARISIYPPNPIIIVLFLIFLDSTSVSEQNPWDFRATTATK